MVTGGYSVVDTALKHIHAESATATSTADLEAIRALIRGYPGGFDTLNEVIKQRLQAWFEAQGGIKVLAAPVQSKASLFGSHGHGKTDTLRAMATAPVADDEQYQSYEDIMIGDRVTVSRYQGAGVIRFIGIVHTDRTHGEHRVGVELDRPEGKHNGTIDGRQYFKCPERHGLLVPRTRIKLLARRDTVIGAGKRSLEDVGGFGFDTGRPGELEDSKGGRQNPASFGYGTADPISTGEDVTESGNGHLSMKGRAGALHKDELLSFGMDVGGDDNGPLVLEV